MKCNINAKNNLAVLEQKICPNKCKKALEDKLFPCAAGLNEDRLNMLIFSFRNVILKHNIKATGAGSEHKIFKRVFEERPHLENHPLCLRVRGVTRLRTLENA